MKKLRIECPLDQQYADLYEAALRVSASYLERINAAIKLNEGRRLFTHYLISVRITGPSSWRANWIKKNYVKDTEASQKKAKKLRPSKVAKAGETLGVAIPQGGKFQYAAATFRYMPIEIRNIALRHESLLADLRKQAFENRQLKKSTYYAIARTKEVISATDDAIKASDILSELNSSPQTGFDSSDDTPR
jgi:hypothetical protein